MFGRWQLPCCFTIPAVPQGRASITLITHSMNKMMTCMATAVLAASCLVAQAQDGGKMLKKEGKTDDKLLRENRRMMKDGKVKRNESMTSEPKLIKEEDRLDHRKAGKGKL